MICGYVGMMVAVFSNARTAIAAKARDAATGDDAIGWTNSFNAAFRAGSVMGFSLCGLSMGILYILCLIYNSFYPFDDKKDPKNVTKLFECIAGYGLGGSSIAMFGRVGGGQGAGVKPPDTAISISSTHPEQLGVVWARGIFVRGPPG